MSGPIHGHGGTGRLRGTGKIRGAAAASQDQPSATPVARGTSPLAQSSALTLSNGGDSSQAVALKQEIAGLLPGAKFSEDHSRWSVPELQSLRDLLGRLSPQDRQRLANTEFIKGDKARGDAAVGNTKQEGGFSTIRQDGSKALYFYDAAYNDKQLGSNIAGGVLAHEMGHLVQTFSREDVLEFAKLGWEGKDGSKSYAEFRKVDDPANPYGNLKPDPAHAPISDVGKLSPEEDFAESYRLFMNDPEALLKASPDRFLYLRLSSTYQQTGVGPVA